MNNKNSIRFMLTISFALLLAACSAEDFAGSPAVEAKAPAVPTAAVTASAASPVGAAHAAADGEAVANESTPLMDHVPLQEALNQLQPQDVFRNFSDITQVPRPSGHTEEIRAFLVAFGEGLGLETIVDQAGNVIIRRPPTPGLDNRAGVVLQAHMDMVPQKDENKVFDFAVDPIQAFVDGEYIVTEGTTLGADDGIGMAMIMAVLQSETLQAGPIEGLFTVDEETDMSGINGLAPGVLQGTTLINLDSEEEGTFTIGSAGGEHAEIHFSYPQEQAPEDMVSYKTRVEGLQGGHSGVDINLGRGHATKILVRLLKEAAEPYGVRLASISSGTAGNAIPREAEALVFIPAAQVDPFISFSKDFEAKVRAELQAVEPDLSIEVTEAEAPQQVMEESFQATVIDALYGTPQGVLRMSDAVPGLVETSTNMGITNAQDGQLEVISYLRSSVDSALEDTGQMIASVWALAGMTTDISGAYGGWAPDPNSPILAHMQEVYEGLYGQEPVISAVHAGLECGVVATSYPDMDMISVGPTIENVHSPSERLHIPSVPKTMALLVETLQAMPD
jgi:dipeptidase D